MNRSTITWRTRGLRDTGGCIHLSSRLGWPREKVGDKRRRLRSAARLALDPIASDDLHQELSLPNGLALGVVAAEGPNGHESRDWNLVWDLVDPRIRGSDRSSFDRR